MRAPMFQFHRCHHIPDVKVGEGCRSQRNGDNVWLLNVLTGENVAFPCAHCHVTIQDFITLECPELRLVEKKDETTDWKPCVATTCDLPIHSVDDAYATMGDENVTGNKLFTGERSPSDDPIYQPKNGEPYLACALRRLQDEVLHLKSAPECQGLKSSVSKGGYSVGRPDKEVVSHRPQDKQVLAAKKALLASKRVELASEEDAPLAAEGAALLTGKPDGKGAELFEDEEAWEVCLFAPVLCIRNHREGEAPFLLMECTAISKLHHGMSTSYVMIQCPTNNNKAMRPTGADEQALACHRWHAQRRKNIIAKHRPVVAPLLAPEPCHANTAILATGVLVQPAVAMLVVPYVPFWGLVLLAWTIGAFFTFAFQALNHELSHELKVTKIRKIANNGLMIGGASMCLFPWHTYYTIFHSKHHQYTGANTDKDGVILFSAWYRPFPFLESTRVGRFIWTGIFGLFIFGFYLYNKFLELDVDCAKLPEKYRAQLRRETWVGLAQLLGLHFSVWTLIHVGVYCGGGWAGVGYMVLSAAFGNGAFAHPYLGFWIIQHQCCAADEQQFQPTVSYTGSWWWHLLNLGELRHVEHHDFPTVPWTKLHKISTLAPEYYTAPTLFKHCPSICAEIWKFLSASSNEEWLRDNGDFAGRSRFLEYTAKVWPSRYENS